MEEILHDINRQIGLNEVTIKKNNAFLKQFLPKIVEKMKSTDALFKALYEQVFYGGSYYDSLKVSNPDEYDLDLLLRLPADIKPVLRVHDDAAGCVYVKLENLAAFDNQPTLKDKYRGLEKLYDTTTFDLGTKKVLVWIQHIMSKAFTDNGTFNLKIPEYGNVLFVISQREGSPAFTLKIDHQDIKMDIDLVPCYVFEDNHWPCGFKKKPDRGGQFFIVPKYPDQNYTRYWRLSFQEQEKHLIYNLGRLKPALRLLKKLRDTQQHHVIASYYLKTIVMLETEESRLDWNLPLSSVFMQLLKAYHEYLSKYNIPYFWKEDVNLLAKLRKDTIDNIRNRISYIIKVIERNPENPEIIKKFLLTADEQIPTKMSEVDCLTNEVSNLSIGTTVALAGVGIGALAAGALIYFSRRRNQ